MTKPPSTQERERGKFPEQLLNCLSIDLEIDVQSRMTALAAWRPDNDDELHFQDDNAWRPESLHRVDRMSQNASFILGHNIIKFDIPHLRAISPSLELLKLPAVDTLWLNPLAYPKRPYHRLVKHYKDGGLVRPQRNNPLLDSKLAFEALKNQAERFLEMAPEMQAAYHHLCTAQGEPGPDLVFTSVRKAPRPDDQAGAAAIRNLLKDRACQNHLEEAIARIPRTGWELAYATAWITIEERDSSLAPWVLYQFPETHEMIRSLRATACANPDCRWCRTRHDPKTELRRWFGFDGFRAQPATPEGLSIQEKVVTSALAQQDQLAILPTGSGKSLCYQLPGADQVRPDGRPDRRHLPPGGPDGGPGTQHAAGPHGLRNHQQPAVAPGADAEPQRRPPGPGRNPAHIPGAAQEQKRHPQPGDPPGRPVGAGRSSLPLKMGARLSP